jgi:hypothetical protein
MAAEMSKRERKKMRKADKGKAQTTPLRALEGAPVKQLDNGDLVVSADTLRQIRDERLRRVSVSGIPSTPRHLTRDGGGVGVAKGGSRVYQITMEALRAIRERAPILQPIHAARAAQVGRMSSKWNGKRGDVGWRVVHKEHHEHDAQPPPEIEPFIARFEEMLERPAPHYDCKTTADLLVPSEEDLLTINRPIIETLHSALDPERLVGFRPVDGNIIWPTLVWLEKWKRDTPDWFQPYDKAALTTRQELDIASAAIGADLHLAKYALVRDGILEGVIPPGKLIVAPRINRTDINVAGYPPSTVEQAVELVVGFINTFDYNANFFTRGMMAEFILGISGDLHDDDVDAFVDMLRESTQGVQRAWQPPVMPLPAEGDLKKIDLKPANKEMMYEVWSSLLVALCTACYRMDPTTINAKPWDGGSSPALSAPNRNLEIALAKEEGLQADLRHLADHMLTPLARRVHPDLRVIFEYGDFDPEKEAKIYEIRSKVDMTRNEVRLEMGVKPNGFFLPRDKYDELYAELIELALKGDADDAEEEQEQVGPDGMPAPPAAPDKKTDRTELIKDVLDRYESNLWNQPADPGFVNAFSQAKQMEQFADQGGGEEEGDGFGGGPGGEFPGAAPPQPGEEGEEGQAPPGGPPGEQPAPGGAPGAPGGQFPFGQVPEDMAKASTRYRGVTVYVHDID